MFEVGEYVVYNKNICKIVKIKEKHYHNVDYYVLEPIDDNTLIIEIPVTIKSLRKVISNNMALELIKKIPEIDVLENYNDKILEKEYKLLLKKNNFDNIIKIIKTTYLRNKERLDNNKKISEIDDNYFKIAEKLLYSEFSVAMGLSYLDTKNYIINYVKQKMLINKN